jgi:hypothetical protein
MKTSTPQGFQHTRRATSLAWLRRQHLISMSHETSAPWTFMAMLALSTSFASGVEADEAGGQLLLRDFKPRSMLQVAETKVDRARFPVSPNGVVVIKKGTVVEA